MYVLLTKSFIVRCNIIEHGSYFTGSTNNSVVLGAGVGFVVGLVDHSITFAIKTTSNDGTIFVGDSGAINVVKASVMSGKLLWQVEGYDDLLSTILVNDNEWHHISLVFKQSTSYYYLYINGVEDNKIKVPLVDYKVLSSIVFSPDSNPFTGYILGFSYCAGALEVPHIGALASQPRKLIAHVKKIFILIILYSAILFISIANNEPFRK